MTRMNAQPRRDIAQDEFLCLCDLVRSIPAPVREHRFHPTRKWRFDYAWPEEKLALEVEGGAFVGGRHTRGAGYVKDLEKYSEALCMGWVVLRVTPRQIRNGEALAYIERFMEMRNGLGNRLDPPA